MILLPKYVSPLAWATLLFVSSIWPVKGSASGKNQTASIHKLNNVKLTYKHRKCRECEISYMWKLHLHSSMQNLHWPVLGFGGFHLGNVLSWIDFRQNFYIFSSEKRPGKWPMHPYPMCTPLSNAQLCAFSDLFAVWTTSWKYRYDGQLRWEWC